MSERRRGRACPPPLARVLPACILSAQRGRRTPPRTLASSANAPTCVRCQRRDALGPSTDGTASPRISVVGGVHGEVP